MQKGNSTQDCALFLFLTFLGAHRKVTKLHGSGENLYREGGPLEKHDAIQD